MPAGGIGSIKEMRCAVEVGMHNRIWLCSLLVIFLNSVAWAHDYKNLGVKGTKGNSMGEASIVQGDEPSAIAFNPAGLPTVTGDHVSTQAAFCDSYVRHAAPSGDITNNADCWQTVAACLASRYPGEHGAALLNGVFDRPRLQQALLISCIMRPMRCRARVRSGSFFTRKAARPCFPSRSRPRHE